MATTTKRGRDVSRATVRRAKGARRRRPVATLLAQLSVERWHDLIWAGVVYTGTSSDARDLEAWSYQECRDVALYLVDTIAKGFEHEDRKAAPR